MSSDDSKIYDKIRRRVIERGREIEETRERREELRFEIEALREVSDLPDAEFEAIVRDVCAEELNDLPKEVSEEILQDLLDGLGRGGAGDPSEVDGKRRRRRGRSEAPREERGRFNKRDAPQERRKSSGRRFVFLFGILFLIAGYLIFVKPPSLGEWDRGGLKVARKAKSQDENSLVEAAQEGHLEMVRQLVEAGVEPDVGHFILGQTPLMLAAENGDGPIVTFLLENGADARLRDPGGRSALDYAYPMSSESLVPILAKAYAEASPEGSIPRELWERGIPYSHEAFRESLQERNLEVVEIFLSDGDRDLLAATIYGTNTLMDGITAAAEGNRFDLVRRLVTEIEQRELTDRDRSRLAQALKAALYYEDPEAAKTLTDLGAPLVWPAWARSGDSLPPRTLSPDMVQVLMDLGARVNAQDGWGEDPPPTCSVHSLRGEGRSSSGSPCAWRGRDRRGSKFRGQPPGRNHDADDGRIHSGPGHERGGRVPPRSRSRSECEEPLRLHGSGLSIAELRHAVLGFSLARQHDRGCGSSPGARRRSDHQLHRDRATN